MRKIGLLLTAFMLFTCIALHAQEEKVEFSLEQAREFAMENSYILKNSRADIKAAKKKVWETTAAGLPQASVEGSYTYMLKVPEASAMFSGLGGMISGMMDKVNKLDNQLNGTPIPDPIPAGEPVSESDLKWGATMDVKVTQLIFSGAYIVGLQASKTYRNITELLDKKNTDDVMESVFNSYVLVLIAEENRSILKTTHENLKKTLFEVTAMHKEGFTEDTDVDQLQLTVTNIENSLSMLDRQVELAYRLLKFQMGMDVSTDIKLTDKLNDLVISSNLATMANMNFDVNSNINYKLVSNQEEISHLNLKLSKTEYLPTVAAFYNHNENFNDKAFNMNPADVVGVSVSLPIFSSGQRIAKVGQARIEYDKAKRDKEKAVQGLILDFEQSKTNYLTSLDKYKNSRVGMNLSKKIFDKTTIKYKEGISSSLDLTQTQNQYLQSQSDYYNSILELFKNKNKLDKIIKKH